MRLYPQIIEALKVLGIEQWRYFHVQKSIEIKWQKEG